MKKLSLYIILSLFMVINVVGAVPFNTTELDASENIYEQSVALNNLVDGLLGLGLLLIGVVIAFVITTINTGDALSGAVSGSFIGTVLGLLLLVLNLILFWQYQIILIMLATTVAAKILLGRRGF